nr:C39 family peptidase [Planosporangium thailandense]
MTFQYQAQINGWYCGPAATRIALTARGKFPTQDAVAAVLGTTTSGTDSAADTTRGLNALLGETTYQTHLIAGNAPTPAEAAQFQTDVVRAVGNGYAVVANIVGTAVDVTGAAHSYGNGHFLTVVGYRDDGRTVDVADPANPGGDGTYWMATANFARWMAHRGYSA